MLGWGLNWGEVRRRAREGEGGEFWLVCQMNKNKQAKNISFLGKQINLLCLKGLLLLKPCNFSRPEPDLQSNFQHSQD